MGSRTGTTVGHPVCPPARSVVSVWRWVGGGGSLVVMVGGPGGGPWRRTAGRRCGAAPPDPGGRGSGGGGQSPGHTKDSDRVGGMPYDSNGVRVLCQCRRGLCVAESPPRAMRWVGAKAARSTAVTRWMARMVGRQKERGAPHPPTGPSWRSVNERNPVVWIRTSGLAPSYSSRRADPPQSPSQIMHPTQVMYRLWGSGF